MSTPWLTGTVNVLRTPATFPSCVSYVCPPHFTPCVASAVLYTTNHEPRVVSHSIATYGMKSRLTTKETDCFPEPEKLKVSSTQTQGPTVHGLTLIQPPLP